MFIRALSSDRIAHDRGLSSSGGRHAHVQLRSPTSEGYDEEGFEDDRSGTSSVPLERVSKEGGGDEEVYSEDEDHHD